MTMNKKFFFFMSCLIMGILLLTLSKTMNIEGWTLGLIIVTAIILNMTATAGMFNIVSQQKAGQV
ncbi:hypothetical protein JOD21_001359 [Jeotgalibacillus terrae]|nr:hypothetical protein [Jeotgalibacillus terrae]